MRWVADLEPTSMVLCLWSDVNDHSHLATQTLRGIGFNVRPSLYPCISVYHHKTPWWGFFLSSMTLIIWCDKTRCHDERFTTRPDDIVKFMVQVLSLMCVVSYTPTARIVVRRSRDWTEILLTGLWTEQPLFFRQETLSLEADIRSRTHVRCVTIVFVRQWPYSLYHPWVWHQYDIAW